MAAADLAPCSGVLHITPETGTCCVLLMQMVLPCYRVACTCIRPLRTGIEDGVVVRAGDQLPRLRQLPYAPSTH